MLLGCEQRNVGCFEGNTKIIASFDQTCNQEDAEGSFSLPKAQLKRCNIINEGRLDPEMDSSAMSLPELEFKLAKEHSDLTLQIISGRFGSDCNIGSSYFSEIKDDFEALKAADELTRLEEPAEGLRSSKAPLKKRGTDYTFYFIASEQNGLQLYFRCYNGGCTSSKISILNGKYRMVVTGPEQSLGAPINVVSAAHKEILQYYTKPKN